MTCPHAETTTIAWMYGDAHDSHALHVASCVDCTAVLDLHERVGRTTARVAPLLRRPVEVRRPRGLVVAGVVALAAAVLLAVAFGTSPAPTPPATASLASPTDPFADPLDAELDDLAAQIELPADEFTSL